MNDYACPIVQDDLYELIVTAKIEDALYLTGVLVLDEKIDDLEDIWIRACSRNELKGVMPSAWKWKDIINDTYNIVKSESFNIEEALLLTTKMCIFNKELLLVQNGASFGGEKKPMVHIKHLRNIILEDFPEAATLSSAGVKRYKRILPEDTEELLFAHRILSGLSRIWTEKQFEKSRDALEYLSRRRLTIKLPDPSWPSPTPENVNEFIWFLWGAVMCFFQHIDIVYKIFFLFKKATRKNRKQQRLGLLWHIGYILGTLEGSPWTTEENKWLAYVKENSSSIWEQIRDTQRELKETERSLKKQTGNSSPIEDFDEIFSYIPRTGEPYTAPENKTYQPSYMFKNMEEDTYGDRKIKIIGLKTDRDRSSVSHSTILKLE